MQTKISSTLKMQFLILIAVSLLGNSALAGQVTRISINVTINGAASDDDYVEYWYKGEYLRDIRGAASLVAYTDKNVKFVAHGRFKDWSGSSCKSSSEKILEFKTSGDCSVTANFAAADTDADTDADTGRRR